MTFFEISLFATSHSLKIVNIQIQMLAIISQILKKAKLNENEIHPPPLRNFASVMGLGRFAPSPIRRVVVFKETRASIGTPLSRTPPSMEKYVISNFRIVVRCKVVFVNFRTLSLNITPPLIQKYVISNFRIPDVDRFFHVNRFFDL